MWVVAKAFLGVYLGLLARSSLKWLKSMNFWPLNIGCYLVAQVYAFLTTKYGSGLSLNLSLWCCGGGVLFIYLFFYQAKKMYGLLFDKPPN